MSFEWQEPDPAFWKGPYAYLWKKHFDNVKGLRTRLIEHYPKLEKSMKFGLGALSEGLLEIPPEQKGEADVTLYNNYKPVCSIEVSGSDRVKMPNVIWIRPDKLEAALSKKEPTFYWMVYPNEVRIVRRKVLEEHREDVHVHYLKWNERTGEKIPEKYIHVPYEETEDPSWLFRWIDGELGIKK